MPCNKYKTKFTFEKYRKLSKEEGINEWMDSARTMHECATDLCETLATEAGPVPNISSSIFIMLQAQKCFGRLNQS